MRLLPYRDKHGRRVYIYRSGVWNPETVTFEQGFATGYKILEMVSLEPKTQVGTTFYFVKVSNNRLYLNQVAGITAVFDGKGFGFKQFSSVSLENQLVVINLVQQGFPLWFRQVRLCKGWNMRMILLYHRSFHVVNAPMLFSVGYNILKPFLAEEYKVQL